MSWRVGLLVLLIGLASCAHPLTTPEQAMRPAGAPSLADDLPLDSLAQAIEGEIPALERNPSAQLVFGLRRITQGDYAKALRHVAELARAVGPKGSRDEFFAAIRKDFDFYEVNGDNGWSRAFVTSYFEPRLKGALARTDVFTQPLYKAPSDLLALDLATFDPKYAQDRKLRARLDGHRLLPYYTREEIDSRQALRGRGLELCWVDPIDAFMLQVQGSGVVELADGRTLQINFAEKNGQPYESIGKFLRDRIPLEQLNAQTIEAYLRTVSPEERQRILNLNPSYVFFQKLNQSAVTFMGVQATDGRTIATDRKYFPKGALAFLSFEKPRFAPGQDLQPEGMDTSSRFVLDQDAGGAIQGGGRVDLFWGRGDEAKRFAGAVKSKGHLYYLVPKP